MHRQRLLDMLDDYARRYPAERACAARVVAFVADHPDCFERSLAIGHVTGSAWVVDAGGRRVLLHHHRKLDKWLQFGGHADGCADPLAVALREAREESALDGLEPVWPELFDLDVHAIPARGAEPAHDHYDARFALRATGGDAFRVSEESHDLAWVEVARLEAYTREPSMLRMRDKWLALRGRG